MSLDAVINLYPNAQHVRETEQGYEAWDAQGNEVALDTALIQTEVQRLQAEYDANQYQRDRATEYPSIEDQLDDIFHNGIDGWKLTIQAVKNKYPKA